MLPDGPPEADVRVLAVLEQLDQRQREHPGTEQRPQEHEGDEKPVVALRREHKTELSGVGHQQRHIGNTAVAETSQMSLVSTEDALLSSLLPTCIRRAW